MLHTIHYLIHMEKFMCKDKKVKQMSNFSFQSARKVIRYLARVKVYLY